MVVGMHESVTMSIYTYSARHSSLVVQTYTSVCSVEDEFHVILICPLYSNVRTEYFLQRWLCGHMCYQLFYDIMSTKNNNEIFRLSKFIYKAFLLRDTF